MSLAFCIIIEPSFRYCLEQLGRHDAKDTSDTYNTYGSILTVLQTAYNKVLILKKKTQRKKKTYRSADAAFIYTTRQSVNECLEGYNLV